MTIFLAYPKGDQNRSEMPIPLNRELGYAHETSMGHFYLF